MHNLFFLSSSAYPASIRQVPSPASQLLFAGNQITYSCVAHGAPPPYFVWLHNGVELTRDDGERDAVTRETTSELVLPELSVEDGGVYTCRAVNEVDEEAFGSDDAQVTLDVIGK